MGTRGFSVQITNLSPKATEKDLFDFFAICGAILHVEFIRADESTCTAYVIFRNPHAVETAVLLSGESILDQPVIITQWGHYEDEHLLGDDSSWKIEDESSSNLSRGHTFAPSVSSMAAKGYVMGKDAVGKAKAFGEAHQVPRKIAGLSEGIGLTGTIHAGVETAKSVDQRYRISVKTKSIVSATQITAKSAANSVVKSSYFSKGALWVSGALSKASQVAGDLGSRGVGK